MDAGVFDGRNAYLDLRLLPGENSAAPVTKGGLTHPGLPGRIRKEEFVTVDKVSRVAYFCGSLWLQ